MNYLYVIFIAMVESFFLCLNTKFLQRNKKIPCFISSAINATLWLAVFTITAENLHNLNSKICYVFGFASGDVVALLMDSYLEKLSKIRGLKFKKKYSKRKK